MRITIDVSRTRPLQPGEASAALRRRTQQFLVRALERGVAIARDETPSGATSALRGTIDREIVDLGGGVANFTGDVVWPQPYGVFVDLGTKPHIPPIGPLMEWARRVLGDEGAAWPIQKAIAKRGTPSPNHPRPGKGMAIRTRQRLDEEIGALYSDAIRRFMIDIGG